MERKNSGPLSRFIRPFPSILAFLLFVFLVIFPKGGIKVGDIPLTWGYLILFCSGASYFLFNNLLFISLPRAITVLSIIPFQIISILVMHFNGVGSTGFAISFLINFFILPWIFLIILPRALDKLERPLIYHRICQAVSIIALIGIIQFSLKILTGKDFHIPFLTINFHDLYALDLKCNNRGILSKLTSTFQNGNIYGICLCMLLPLMNLLETSPLKKIVVKLSFILTLSRTAWVALFLSEILDYFFIKKTRSPKKLLLIFSVFSAGIYLITIQLNANIWFLFDRNLGGRVHQLDALTQAELISTLPFSGLEEMVYFQILKQFGVIGLCLFLITMTAPLISYLFFLPKTGQSKEEASIKTSLFLGLILYLIIACSDGAILYIPVMAFYWGLSSLLLTPKMTQQSALGPRQSA